MKNFSLKDVKLTDALQQITEEVVKNAEAPDDGFVIISAFSPMLENPTIRFKSFRKTVRQSLDKILDPLGYEYILTYDAVVVVIKPTETTDK